MGHLPRAGMLTEEERNMTDTVQPSEIQPWLDLLRSRVSTERLQGATELASLAVRTHTRGAVRTRGTISRAAPSRLPQGVSLATALEAFTDQHIEVRRAVAFALGEWADETAVRALRPIMEADPEPAVRGEALDALGKIGGQQAVEALQTAARNDRGIDVRLRAVRALAALGSVEPAASQGVITTLEHVQDEDLSEAVRGQAQAALARLGRA